MLGNYFATICPCRGSRMNKIFMPCSLWALTLALCQFEDACNHHFRKMFCTFLGVNVCTPNCHPRGHFHLNLVCTRWLKQRWAGLADEMLGSP